jgi:uncharacterized membrane protein (UPF0127 family)
LTLKTIVNKTRNTVIADEAVLATGFSSRLLGLMFRSGLLEGQGLWIEPCADIHSCFMNFTFDAIFISKELKIVAVESEVKPWRFIWTKKHARSVLELPAGIIARTQCQVGDQLAWQATEA